MNLETKTSASDLVTVFLPAVLLVPALPSTTVLCTATRAGLSHPHQELTLEFILRVYPTWPPSGEVNLANEDHTHNR